jgi:hypothetical protein
MGISSLERRSSLHKKDCGDFLKERFARGSLINDLQIAPARPFTAVTAA